MKKSVKYLLYALALAALLLLATLGYKYLSERYQPEQPPLSAPTATTQPSDAPMATAAVVTTMQASFTQAPTATAANKATLTPTTAPVRKAADFAVLNVAGDAVALSDFLGKPVVVNFWATWCGPCKVEMPAFNELYEKYGDDVAFMMVNMTDGRRDTVDGAKAFVENAGYTFPVYFDVSSSAAMAYYVRSIPLTVFVDRDGAFVGSHLGTMSHAALENGVKKLLAE